MIYAQAHEITGADRRAAKALIKAAAVIADALERATGERPMGERRKITPAEACRLARSIQERAEAARDASAAEEARHGPFYEDEERPMDNPIRCETCNHWEPIAPSMFVEGDCNILMRAEMPNFGCIHHPEFPKLLVELKRLQAELSAGIAFAYNLIPDRTLDDYCKTLDEQLEVVNRKMKRLWGDHQAMEAARKTAMQLESAGVSQATDARAYGA